MEHPFADLIGMKTENIGEGSSEISIHVGKKLLSPHNALHGGVLYSLADTGMGAAIYSLLEEGELCATIDIKINYYAPVFAGKVICLTRVINKGKTVVNLESEIKVDDKLVAKANGNFAIFRPAKKQ